MIVSPTLAWVVNEVPVPTNDSGTDSHVMVPVPGGDTLHLQPALHVCHADTDVSTGSSGFYAPARHSNTRALLLLRPSFIADSGSTCKLAETACPARLLPRKVLSEPVVLALLQQYW